MKIKTIIFIILGILFVSYLIYGFCLNMKARSLCNSECEDRGTFASKRYPNGELNINDLCVCYFPGNRIESFVLK